MSTDKEGHVYAVISLLSYFKCLIQFFVDFKIFIFEAGSLFYPLLVHFLEICSTKAGRLVWT
jgi:hypothetical protein